MKLLFDQNLSPKLGTRLADLFLGSAHVLSFNLDCSSDDDVWAHALQYDFAVVTKDEDYEAISLLRGCPPKVIWLTVGNCTTREVEVLFRARFDEIQAFGNDPNTGVLVLG